MKRNRIYRAFCSLFLTGGSIYAFNKIYNVFATRKHRLYSHSENYITWRGLKVFYQKKGTGSPVILLHALHPASSACEWSEIESYLSKNHTVYTVDLPGCGRSDKPKIYYTNFFYVSFIKDFLQMMSVRKPCIIASNSSASIAVMAEAYEPGLFSKLILISPSSLSDLAKMPDRVSKLYMYLLTCPVLGNFIYNIVSSKPQVDLSFTEKYFYNPFHDNDDLVDLYFESAHLGNGNGNYLYGSIVGRYLNINISYALSHIKCPVKLIAGRSLRDVDSCVREWVSVRNDIDVSFIDHTKQLPHLEEPQNVLDLIEDFLEFKNENII